MRKQDEGKEEKEAFEYTSFEASAIASLQEGKPLFGEGGVLKDLIRHLVEASS